MKISALSASRIGVFRDCELQYWFQYESDVKGGDVWGYGVGSLTHKALELWHLAQEVDWTSLEKKVWEASEVSNVTDKDIISETIAILYEWHQRYTPENIIGIEQKFKLMTKSGAPILGYIDKVVQLDEHSIAIVDYKTSWRPKSRDEMDGDVQLGLYALAARQLYPWARSVYMVLDYIRHTPQETQFTDSDLDFLDKYLGFMYQKILNTNSKDAKATPSANACRWCAYTADCPAYQELITDDNPDLTINHEDMHAIVEEYDALGLREKAIGSRRGQLKEQMLGAVSSNRGEKIVTEGWELSTYQRRDRNYDTETVLKILGPEAAGIVSVSAQKMSKLLSGDTLHEEVKAALASSVRITRGAPILRAKLKKTQKEIENETES